MRRTLVGFVLVTVLTGCVSPLDRLDQRVAKLIGQQQQSTLGPDATDDPQPVPVRLFAPKPQRDMYRYDPDTTNPTPDQLPATTNPNPGADLAEPKADSPVAAAIVMDLEQALGYAIAHSRDYRNRKEDLFLAALDLLVERHLWGPLFFHDVTAEFSGTPEAGDHDQVLTLINELRVTQRLPYGGDLSVSALVAYVSVLQNATGLSPEQSQSSSLALSIRQPLMRGFGKVAREVLIRTERELVYAVRDFERFRRQLLVDIAADYYGLLAQQARIENLKTNVANFELLARRFEALAKAGRAPYFQAESFQQQVLFARNDLFTAEQQYDSSLDAFKIRLGMPTRQPLIIAPSEVIVPEPSLDSVAAVVTAFELRLDLQTTADQVDDARRQVKIARNELLPDLDLFADVTVPTDPDKDEGGVDFSFGDGSYTAGFTFGSPIERTVERAQHREALINFERAQRSYTLQRDRVAQEVRNAVRGIQQARFSLQLQNRNVKLTERSRLGLKLQERRAPIRDVINAEDDLLDAKDRQDEAVRNLRVSILRYLLTTGQMRVSSAGQWLAPARLVPLPEASPDADGPEEPADSHDGDPLTDRSGHVNIDPRWVQPARIVRPMMTP